MAVNNRYNKIGIIVFLAEEEYAKYFVAKKSSSFGPVTSVFYDWVKSCKQLMRVVYNIFWLYWLENASKERTILCCDTRRTACHLTAWFGIENVILADDVAIKKSTVRELNRKYNRDLVVIKDCLGGTDLLCDFFDKLDIPENSNIFLTIGEYESITDFELALEAFYMLVNNKMNDMSLKKVTFLVILGDELEFNGQQQNYYKKLEGLVTKSGLRDNVYFLKINPLVSKEMLMKSSLAIIFPNRHGCYKKNLQEALSSGKNVIAPNTQFYRNFLISKGEMGDNMLYSPDPITYAKAMYKLVKNKIAFRLVTNLAGIELKK